MALKPPRKGVNGGLSACHAWLDSELRSPASEELIANLRPWNCRAPVFLNMPWFLNAARIGIGRVGRVKHMRLLVGVERACRSHDAIAA